MLKKRTQARLGRMKGVCSPVAIAATFAMLLTGCGAATSSHVTAPSFPPVQALQTVDVQKIVKAAVNSVNVDMVVAVVDRAGFVLGVFRTQNAPATALGNFGQTLDAN